MFLGFINHLTFDPEKWSIILRMGDIIDFRGTVSELESLIDSLEGLSVVDINASWCPSCRRLGQILPKILRENANVNIIKVDIDENPEIKEHFGVESIPVIKFCLQDKKLDAVETLVGVNVPLIKQKIAELNPLK